MRETTVKDFSIKFCKCWNLILKVFALLAFFSPNFLIYFSHFQSCNFFWRAISFNNFSNFSSLKIPYVKSWKILVYFSLIGGPFIPVFPNYLETSWSISSSSHDVTLPVVSTVFISGCEVKLLVTVVSTAPWKCNAFCIRANAWFSDMLFGIMDYYHPHQRFPLYS